MLQILLRIGKMKMKVSSLITGRRILSYKDSYKHERANFLCLESTLHTNLVGFLGIELSSLLEDFAYLFAEYAGKSLLPLFF
jgi:hypothetical protein